MSEHLRGMLLLDLVTALYHPDEILDKEQFIADFTEIIIKHVRSFDDPN